MLTGFEVPVRQWGDPIVARFGIIIFHGMTEHSGRYDRLGRWIAEQSGLAIAADHVGHGETCTDRLGELGDEGWEGLIQRNRRLVQWVLGRYPTIPWVILGHSMGSFIAQEVVSRFRPPIVGLALSGASFESRWATGFGWGVSWILAVLFGKSSPGSIVYHILYGGFNRTFRPHRTRFDWLSRNTAVVDSYIADPRCGFVPPLSFYVAAFKAFYYLFSARFFADFSVIPILILTGKNDPVTHFGKGSLSLRDRYIAGGNDAVVAIQFPEMRHVVWDELGDDAVYAAFKEWLSANCSDRV